MNGPYDTATPSTKGHLNHLVFRPSSSTWDALLKPIHITGAYSRGHFYPVKVAKKQIAFAGLAIHMHNRYSVNSTPVHPPAR